jgi:hypothetical protein
VASCEVSRGFHCCLLYCPCRLCSMHAKMSNECKTFVGKHKRMKPLIKPRRQKDNADICLKINTVCGYECINLAYNSFC